MTQRSIGLEKLRATLPHMSRVNLRGMTVEWGTAAERSGIAPDHH